MLKRFFQTTYFKNIIETLSLACLLGVCFGIVFGIIEGWKYFSNGFYLPFLDTLNLSINNGIYVSFLLLFLFLLVFQALRNLVKNNKSACFISCALSCIPLFLYWGYKLNRYYGIESDTFFRYKVFILNLKLIAGFLFLWLAASILLFFWTKSRILRTHPGGVGLLGLLLVMVLVSNVSALSLRHFQKSKQDYYNVLVVLVDCLRADELGIDGYHRDTTPNIDKFSKDAVVFTQAISQATFTKMSIASLFTSLYPYQHGVYRGAGEVQDMRGQVSTDVLGEEETTLAEVLSQNGFLTTAWINSGQLRNYFGFAQGFLDYNEKLGEADDINKKFLEWITRIGKNYTFFAYIHYLDLHGPYKPKPPYDTLYIEKNGNDKNEADAVRERALYDGLLRYVDTEFGKLLDGLKRESLYDNTLIILTSDHGDAFREHGFLSHSRIPYEELVRVPLIIKFPKSANTGKVVKRQVRLIDVMPTILDFQNIKTDLKLEGFSLLGYLDNRDGTVDFPKYAITEIFNKKDNIDALSIRTEEFKYIHLHDKEGELYDLRADPGEKNNIIKLRPEVAEEFRKMLPPILSEKNQKRLKSVTLDKETIEELKALGYIQ